ncbi:MAG: flagellar motor switch protein FliN [Gammaproteobacteria bacterium]
MNDVTNSDADDSMDDWAAAMAEQADAEATQESDTPVAGDAGDQEDYSKADFQNLQDDAALPGDVESNMDMILDIPVTISVEIGRTKINIRNLLKLNQGSVVELDRLAGEPMDVIVNGTLIAHGEIVVVNEKFGVRLTDVISAAERVKKLK